MLRQRLVYKYISTLREIPNNFRCLYHTVLNHKNTNHRDQVVSINKKMHTVQKVILFSPALKYIPVKYKYNSHKLELKIAFK